MTSFRTRTNSLLVAQQHLQQQPRAVQRAVQHLGPDLCAMAAFQGFLAPSCPAHCRVQARRPAWSRGPWLVCKSSTAGPGGQKGDSKGSQEQSAMDKLARLYSRDTPQQSAKPSTPSTLMPKPSGELVISISTGLAALLAVNVGVFAMATWGKSSIATSWMLSHTGAKWWQYALSTFVHISWAHLSRDLVVVWLAGLLTKRDLGASGVWLSYLVCGATANLSAMLFMPATVKAAGGLMGLGATGAAAGVALTALLIHARFTPGFFLAAGLFLQLTLAPMLTLPVPGGPSAAKPLPYSLAGLVLGNAGISDVLSSLRGAAIDPGLIWLWGAGAAALLIAAIYKGLDEGLPRTE